MRAIAFAMPGSGAGLLAAGGLDHDTKLLIIGGIVTLVSGSTYRWLTRTLLTGMRKQQRDEIVAVMRDEMPAAIAAALASTHLVDRVNVLEDEHSALDARVAGIDTRVRHIETRNG